MSSLLFIDSAFPLGKVITGVHGIAFYLGGDTPHIWLKAELDATPYRYRLPVYVRSNPPGPGAAADVAACVTQLKNLGAPRGCLVALDVETAVDASYVQAFYGDLKAAGYLLIVYASQAYIAGQGNPDGLYWGAQWTGAAHIAVGDAMTQYISFSGYDESLALSTLPFWDTQSATVPPPPAGNPWPLSAGSNGANVVTLQQELNRRGYAVPPLTTDGMFGPATLAAVRHAQGVLGMPVTGIVDQALWEALKAVSGPPVPPLYPVPASVTVVARPALAIDWSTSGSPHWRVQVAFDDNGKPGTVIPGGSVLVTVPRAVIAVPHAGKFWVRVQAAAGSPFTAWHEVTA